jgi:sulfur-oxidizing protein SoxB
MHSGQVAIPQVNDTHGYLEPHPELLWEGDHPCFQTLGGYARMAGLLRRIREERRGMVLMLDNGDTFHGAFPVVNGKGETLLPLLNALGFDAMTAYWGFASGQDHLRRLIGRLDYPLLAINCYEGERRVELPAQPHRGDQDRRDDRGQSITLAMTNSVNAV